MQTMERVTYEDLLNWPFKLGASFRVLAKELLEQGWNLSVFEQSIERNWAYFLAEKDGKTELVASLKHELFTGLNGRLGYLITTNKARSYEYAKKFNVRVPESEYIEAATPQFDSFKDWDDVVVKPVNGSGGRGITVGVKDQAALDQAVDFAKGVDNRVVVQEFAHGADYRLLFIDYKLFAAIRRDPASVLGDGLHTVTELIEAKNAIPKGDDYQGTTTGISLKEALRISGQQVLDSVPAEGEKVQVIDKANLSQGGDAYDVTEDVNPSYEEYLAPMIQSLGLKICGIDVISPDITASPREGNYRLLEINAAPNLRPHLYPTQGTSRNAAELITQLLEKA